MRGTSRLRNTEIHACTRPTFGTRLFDESEWDWVEQTQRHSLGWVVARDGERFVGFANVLWDGLVHAFIEDVMVDADCNPASVSASSTPHTDDQAAGCGFLHVGFDEDLHGFYIDACGFGPGSADFIGLSVAASPVGSL